MAKQKIPKLTIPRLSLYYRALLESRESDFISSEEISQLTIVAVPAQVAQQVVDKVIKCDHHCFLTYESHLP